MFVYFNKMIERKFYSNIKCRQTDWGGGGGGGGGGKNIENSSQYYMNWESFLDIPIHIPIKRKHRSIV